MFILKADNLSMEIGGKTLFKNVSIEVKDREKVALIGENGVGKTTLLKGLLGLISFQSGTVNLGIDKKEIGYMVQDNQINNDLNVIDWVTADHPNAVIKKELEKISSLLKEKPTNETLVNQYNAQLQKYLDHNGFEWEIEVEKMLTQLKVPNDLWNIPFSSLSGGQKTRVKLTKIMLNSPKFIILDEPTNHLDIESITWLENWLKQFKGSVLFISHEREFIDHVANYTYELSPDGIKKYDGGYSSYKEQKHLEQITEQRKIEKQEQERKKLLETISQYKQWYDKANAKASVRNPYAQKKLANQAKKFKVKERELERLEKNKINKPVESKKIETNLVSSEFSARKMIDISDISFSYGERKILDNVSLQINRGDRIAVVGTNGSGKTTLLKLMSGIIQPNSGSVLRNPQLKIGHFFQELDNLNLDNTILDEILTIPHMNMSDARTILACFLFRREDVYKKIETLSMGEKCRVAFVKLYFSNANLLILDEPTNYFDIPTREIIENALVEYPGAIVIVAHDPYLLRKVANKVVSLKNGKVSIFPGGYKEWENYENLSNVKQEITNKLEQLQLKYVQLITEETTEDGTQEQDKLIKIQKLKEQIAELKKKLNN